MTLCITCPPERYVRKADRRRCAECDQPICAEHVWIRVDEANESITRNSPLYCGECAESLEPSR